MTQALVWTAAGTGFTFGMTMLGAATVFLFREKANLDMQKIFMGFAAGIMMAASVWSLILPALEQAEAYGGISWVPAALGFVLGGAFLYIADRILSRYVKNRSQVNLMVLAVTIHNIPEGMAVGLAFSLAAENLKQPELYAAALALTLGIGLQNFPEGAAVALPLQQEGMSTKASFFYGAMSAIVEVIFGVFVVLASEWIRPLMPWFLSFAAGAMIYVVVDDLIPMAYDEKSSHKGTMGILAGFLIMMVLDVALSA